MTLFIVSNAFSDNKQTEETPKSLMQKIVDSYMNASKTDSALKNLLDAKMYLSTAEHDLLVSYDKGSAQKDIENTLNYLLEARKIAKPNNQQAIDTLVQQLKSLEQKTAQTGDFKNENENETDKLLTEANKTLMKAKENAAKSTQNEIELVMTSISKIRNKIEHTNLRSDYETAMQSLNSIINNL